LNRLRYWAYKRQRTKAPAAAERATTAPVLARVVPIRETSGIRPQVEPVVVEVGGARIRVGRGFDRAVLAEVVDVLARAGGRP